MNALKATALAAAAAIALGLAPAPAAAGPHWHGHGGWGHHGGFWGGPGLVLGIAGVALAAGLAADEYCVRYVPVYNSWGEVVGRRAVNAC